MRTGQLFDLGRDGLGFIAEVESDRVWAFEYPRSGAGIASDIDEFIQLEGHSVRFEVNEKQQVGSIQRYQAASR